MAVHCLGVSEEGNIRILYNSDGKWHLIKIQTYKDEAGNEYDYDFPSLNYDLTKFMKYEIPGGWFDNRFPEWAPEFQAKRHDEGQTFRIQKND